MPLTKSKSKIHSVRLLLPDGTIGSTRRNTCAHAIRTHTTARTDTLMKPLTLMAGRKETGLFRGGKHGREWTPSERAIAQTGDSKETRAHCLLMAFAEAEVFGNDMLRLSRRIHLERCFRFSHK